MPAAPKELVSKASDIVARLYLPASVTEREQETTEILAQYRMAPPFRALNPSASMWQTNTSTGFFKDMVDRITSGLSDAIDSLFHLTSSEVTEGDPTLAVSEAIRQEVTLGVRAWPGFQDFKTRLSFEQALLGAGSAVILDGRKWHPTFFKRTDTFLPPGSGQDADGIPYAAFRQMVRPIDAKKIAADPSSAELGWNIENLRKAIEAKESPLFVEGFSGRLEEERIAEKSDYDTTQEADVVPFLHFFQDVWHNDKVCLLHCIYDAGCFTKDEGDTPRVEIFSRLDEDCCLADRFTPFTLDVGIGTFYGSFGAGQVLKNMSVLIEAYRSTMVDAGKLASCAALRIAPASRAAFERGGIALDYPFVQFVAEDGGVQMFPSPFSNAIQPLVAVAQQLYAWADRAVGAYSPSVVNQTGGGDRSATEVSAVASVEQQLHDNKRRRYQKTFMKLVGNCQKIMLSTDCADPIAKKVRKKLKDMQIDQSEMDLFAKSPSDVMVRDKQTTIESLSALRQVLINNPGADLNPIDRLIAAQLVGPVLTNRVLPANADDVQITRAIRNQKLENSAILGGTEIPVDIEDNHEIHATTMLREFFAPAEEAIGAIRELDDSQKVQATEGLKKMLPTMQNGMGHFMRHVQAMQQLKNPDAKKFATEGTRLDRLFRGVAGEIEAFDKQLAEAEMQEQAANQVGKGAAAAMLGVDPSQLPDDPAELGAVQAQ